MTYSKPRSKESDSDVVAGSQAFELTSLFGGEPTELSPEVEDYPGIRIAIKDPDVESGAFSGTLLVTTEFDSAFIGNFRRFMDAPVAIFENTQSGETTLFSLKDTRKRLPPSEADLPNYQPGQSSNDLNSDMSITEYRSIPFALPFDEFVQTPQLYIRVVLREYTSNVIAVGADEDLNPKLAHYLNGIPYEPLYLDIEELDDGTEEGEEDE